MLYYVYVAGEYRAVWEIGAGSPFGLRSKAHAEEYARRVYGASAEVLNVRQHVSRQAR